MPLEKKVRKEQHEISIGIKNASKRLTITKGEGNPENAEADSALSES